MSQKIKKLLSLSLVLLFIFQQSGFCQVAAQLDIAGHLSAFRNSFIQDKFRPLHLRYFSYDITTNNFRILLDKGDLKNLKGVDLESSSRALLNYFLIGVTLPDDKFWVNLRPDSENNIIDDELARTDIGRILLEADLQLKKDTARFTSPQTPEGREYWDKLYKKAGELFGYENITIPTLTRPWIVPDEIIIRETKDSAYVYKATLKVLLEQDHLKNSAVYNFDDPRLKELNEYSSQIIRETIIPKLTKEVNISKRYASLRQMFYSLILARWFKSRFYGKNGFYSNLINRSDLAGLISKENWSKITYFKQYQKSFKDGEYNIQEPVSTPFGQTIRSYFSGGIDVTLPLVATPATPKVRVSSRDVNPGAFTGSTERDLAGVFIGKGKAIGYEGKAGEGDALKEIKATAASPVTNADFISAQIRKLNVDAIEWSGKVPYSVENAQKAQNSIEDIRKTLTELLALIEANESLRAQADKILRAVTTVFDEQGMKLRADAKLYPVHPLQAALNFIKNLGITDPDFIESAILHDTVEDVEQYNRNPDLIGEIFGKTVQRNVQSVTNKELTASQKDFLRRFLIEKLQLDVVSPEIRKSLDAIMNIIEYQVGVIREVSGNPVTLLLKSVDFSDNALTQGNLSSNPKLQSRLSSKYRDLLTIFAEEFEALAGIERDKETPNAALINGLRRNAAVYRAAYTELQGYSSSWENAALHDKVIAVINKDVRFGGLRGLAKELEKSSSPMAEKANEQELIVAMNTLAARIEGQDKIGPDDYKEIEMVIVRPLINLFKADNFGEMLTMDTWNAFRHDQGADAYDANKLKWDESKVNQYVRVLLNTVARIHKKSLALFVERLKSQGKEYILYELAAQTHNSFFGGEAIAFLSKEEKPTVLIAQLDFLTDQEVSDFFITGKDEKGSDTKGEQFKNRRSNPKWKDKLTLSDVKEGKRIDFLRMIIRHQLDVLISESKQVQVDRSYENALGVGLVRKMTTRLEAILEKLETMSESQAMEEFGKTKINTVSQPWAVLMQEAESYTGDNISKRKIRLFGLQEVQVVTNVMIMSMEGILSEAEGDSLDNAALRAINAFWRATSGIWSDYTNILISKGFDLDKAKGIGEEEIRKDDAVFSAIWKGLNSAFVAGSVGREVLDRYPGSALEYQIISVIRDMGIEPNAVNIRVVKALLGVKGIEYGIKTGGGDRTHAIALGKNVAIPDDQFGEAARHVAQKGYSVIDRYAPRLDAWVDADNLIKSALQEVGLDISTENIERVRSYLEVESTGFPGESRFTIVVKEEGETMELILRDLPSTAASPVDAVKQLKESGLYDRLLDTGRLKFESIQRVDLMNLEAAVRAVSQLGISTTPQNIFDILNMINTERNLKQFAAVTGFEALRGIAITRLKEKEEGNLHTEFLEGPGYVAAFRTWVMVSDIRLMIDLSRATPELETTSSVGSSPLLDNWAGYQEEINNAFANSGYSIDVQAGPNNTAVVEIKVPAVIGSEGFIARGTVNLNDARVVQIFDRIKYDVSYFGDTAGMSEGTVMQNLRKLGLMLSEKQVTEPAKQRTIDQVRSDLQYALPDYTSLQLVERKGGMATAQEFLDALRGDVKQASQMSFSSSKEYYTYTDKLSRYTDEGKRELLVIGFFYNQNGYPMGNAEKRVDKAFALMEEFYRMNGDLAKVSSPLLSEADSAKTLGGIDFRTMNILVQPMGNFSGLDFTLPKLNNLTSINLDEEFGQIQNMVAEGIIPSGMRIKELIAACSQKKEINSRVDEMIICLADIFRLEEESLTESSPELKETLVILDSNRFVLQ